MDLIYLKKNPKHVKKTTNCLDDGSVHASLTKPVSRIIVPYALCSEYCAAGYSFPSKHMCVCITVSVFASPIASPLHFSFLAAVMLNRGTLLSDARELSTEQLFVCLIHCLSSWWPLSLQPVHPTVTYFVLSLCFFVLELVRVV